MKNKVPRNKLNQGGKRPVLRKLQGTEKEIKGIQIGKEEVNCLYSQTT